MVEANILFGFHFTLNDCCEEESCTYIPDLLSDLPRLLDILRCLYIPNKPEPFTIFVSEHNNLYFGVQIPSAYNESADMVTNITFSEQIQTTHVDGVTWNDWFDSYHLLQDKIIALSQDQNHKVRVRCQNESPCLFATTFITKLLHSQQ